ncbi:MAG: uroporphyrinogen decarboxylase family protein [Acidimicrobiales bacterium]|jgi:hypothetical protein
MTSSRERVEEALNHREGDRVPLDLGATSCSGIHVSSLYALRQALGLDTPGTPVRVCEPFQMLGEVTPDLLDCLGIDAVRVGLPNNFFGFRNEDWKPWTTFDGTPVLVPGQFPTEPEPNGDLFMYPKGDRSAPPCARMPASGFYFDSITRQEPLEEARLDPADNLEEFALIDDESLEYARGEVARLGATGRALLGEIGGTGFGDAALVPGPTLAHPRGVRDLQQWYMSLVNRPTYVKEVFERQCDIGLENLQRVHVVVGDALSAVFVTGTDFGTQGGPMIGPKTYRALFQPFHARINDWIHTHTTWKTFIHSCGSIWRLLDDIVDAGFDVLNPVQTSAAGMDPQGLKDRYGDRITFWGGGIDTQRVLPFGSPEDVRAMVKERMQIFGPGGGFVFNTIHNVQARVPVANLVALYEAANEYRSYPMEAAVGRALDPRRS